MLDFTPDRPWRPPIVKTVATRREGVEETIAALEAHGAYLAASGEGEKRRESRARARLLALLEERFRSAVEAGAPGRDGLEEAVRHVLEGREDPYSAADRLFAGFVPRNA